MNNLNVNSNHPLIEREQTYFLDRKLISIHSIDRDINKWSNPSLFEVDLPETLKNVYSLRLIQADIPSNLYTFTNNYQNTKISLRLFQDISGGGAEANAITNYYVTNSNYTTIEIDEGYYTEQQLANELENKLNNTISNDIGFTYNKFQVKYDETKHKYFFINTRDNFTFYCNKKEIYTNVACQQPIAWEHYANWGLPYNLGFNKQTYQATQTPTNVDLLFTYDNSSFTPDPSNASMNIKFVVSDNCIDIFGNDCIYLELDRYNSMDEITPYSEATNNLYNNDYTGCVNSAFAKIPIKKSPFNQNFSNTSNLDNITFFKVPITSIKKFKCKFRYHDGTLVDFKNMPYSITIEVTQLIDEARKYYNLNIPFVYST
jgi:hypothetical protein